MTRNKSPQWIFAVAIVLAYATTYWLHDDTAFFINVFWVFITWLLDKED